MNIKLTRIDASRSDKDNRYWLAVFKIFNDDGSLHEITRVIYDSVSNNLYGWNYSNSEQKPESIDEFSLSSPIYDDGPYSILVGLKPERDEQEVIDWWESLDNETKEKNVKALDKLIVESML